MGGGGVAGSWCLRTALSGRYPPGSLFQVITALNTGFFELCSQGFFFLREFEIVSELKVKQITTRETTLRLLVGCLAIGRKGVPMQPSLPPAGAGVAWTPRACWTESPAQVPPKPALWRETGACRRCPGSREAVPA